jgi:hypothetical protein
MMKLFEKRAGKKTRGQTMVEFALVLPVLLLTMYGIMEFGRLLFIYVTTTSAAREATRYASAVEEVGGVERYRDCTGIRTAARGADVLNAIQAINITYYTDYGGAGQAFIGTCPEGGVGPALDLGDQVVVEVIGSFQPIVPMVPIDINRIEAESARTVIKDVPVGVLVPALVPTPQGSPPFVSFGTYYQLVPETAGMAFIPVIAVDPNGLPFGDIEVTYRISSFSEARGGGIDYNILDSSPITIPGITDPSDDPTESSFNIGVEIIDDTLFEYYERIIVHIDSVNGGTLVSPSVHVLYIIDDDRIPPFVEFDTDSSTVSEGGSPAHSIRLNLYDEDGNPTISGRDTYVPINVLSGNATLGRDYNFQTPVRVDAGDNHAYLVVDIFDDSIGEGTEFVEFQIGEPLNGRVDTVNGQINHLMTILDNEPEGHVPNCAYYGLSDWTFSNGTRIGTVNLSNSDPLLAPVYITGISLEWAANTPRLESIHFPTGTQIWPATGIGSEPSRFEYTWGNLALDRQLRQATKQLAFYMSSNNPSVGEITVTLDNNCPSLVLRP